MPLLEVTLKEGRSAAKKAELIKNLTETVVETLARPSRHGQARHRIGRSPIRQEKAAERSLSYGQGLRRRGQPARCDPKGGGYRTTGCVEALARCTDIAPSVFPGLSSDIHRAAPFHCEKSGLTEEPAHFAHEDGRLLDMGQVPGLGDEFEACLGDGLGVGPAV